MNKLIQWPKAEYWDKPWNPVVGCTPVSEGCENCYAAAMMKRFDRSFKPRPASPKPPPKSGVVFVGNMTDLFGEWNSDADILYWMAQLSPDAVNLVLTKRADRMYMMPHNLTHVFMGITAENQRKYEERMQFLSNRHWPNRWVSFEPLLGPVRTDGFYDRPSWAVVGAESGPNRRPCKVEWVELIVEQCRDAGVPVFVKQLDLNGKLVKDINQFPEHLQIRQVPWEAQR